MRVRRSARRGGVVPLAIVIVLASTATALTGCANTAADLPHGITVSVFQNRFDYSVRQLELKVANGSDSDITITGASFDSPRFAQPARWDRPQTIPAGGARDLRVQLTEPRCDGSDSPDSVTLDFTLADSRSGTATLTPTDDRGTVTAVNEQDCLEVSMALHAKVGAAEELIWTPGAHAPAELDLVVHPTPAEGHLVIQAVQGTVLFSLSTAGGDAVTSTAIETTVDSASPDATIPMYLIPNRCDPHAIEEDKRGTFFPLVIETSEGRSGTVYIPVSDAVRRALYEFYGDYCGLP